MLRALHCDAMLLSICAINTHSFKASPVDITSMHIACPVSLLSDCLMVMPFGSHCVS